MDNYRVNTALPTITKPNPAIRTPDTQLIFFIKDSVNWVFSRLAIPLKNTHQMADPAKTPPMSSRVEIGLAFVETMPRLAKMAKKEKIRAGFMRVKISAEK
jgi:hypothetical protein